MTLEEKVLACHGHMSNKSIAQVTGLTYAQVIHIIYNKNRLLQNDIPRVRKNHSLLSLWNSKNYESPNDEKLLWKNLGSL